MIAIYDSGKILKAGFGEFPMQNMASDCVISVLRRSPDLTLEGEFKPVDDMNISLENDEPTFSGSQPGGAPESQANNDGLEIRFRCE